MPPRGPKSSPVAGAAATTTSTATSNGSSGASNGTTQSSAPATTASSAASQPEPVVISGVSVSTSCTYWTCQIHPNFLIFLGTSTYWSAHQIRGWIQEAKGNHCKARKPYPLPRGNRESHGRPRTDRTRRSFAKHLDAFTHHRRNEPIGGKCPRWPARRWRWPLHQHEPSPGRSVESITRPLGQEHTTWTNHLELAYSSSECTRYWQSKQTTLYSNDACKTTFTKRVRTAA